MPAHRPLAQVAVVGCGTFGHLQRGVLQMSGYDPLSPEGDPFYPPTVPTLVQCLHCGEAYDSYLIQWVVEPELQRGFWRCPVEGCDGAGFGFDIFPVDEDFADERGTFGWTEFDDENEEDYLVCDGEDGDEWEGQEEEDWLQVDGDDCIFSIDHDLPTDEDSDWSDTADNDPKDSEKSPPPAEQEARRQQHRRPRFDDDDIPF